MTEPNARTSPPQLLTIIAAVAVMAFVCAAVYWARTILIPVAMAIFFTFVLTPLVMILQRRGLGRVPSVLIVITLSLLVVGSVGLVVGQQLVRLTQTLPDQADRIKAKVANLKKLASGDETSRLGTLVDDVSKMVEPSPNAEGGPTQTVVVKSSPSWVSNVQSYLSPAAEIVGQGAFTLILVVFMLLRREDLRNRVIRLLGPGRLATTTKAVDETSRRISRYLLAQLLLNAAFGLVISIGLLFMGVDYAPLWGFSAFLMRYVPYIGTWIGVIPPALFTFAVSDGWGLTIGVIVLFLGLEMICNNIFEPLLYGSRLGLSEVAQLIATAFWFFLWGPVGMILAWPLTTCLLMCGKYVPQLQFLNVLLGDQPVLPTQLAFYQRVAARDHDEAAQIIEKELKTRPIATVFDEILLAALVEARRDAEEKRHSQEEFVAVLGSIREIADDVADLQDSKDVIEPVESPMSILIAPAKDAADQTAGELLARLLGPGRWQPEVAPASVLISELLAMIEKSNPAIVVIASLPPGGVTHTRYLCKRIRRQFPDVKLVTGRWLDTSADIASTKELVRAAGADELTFTLAETVAHLDAWWTVLSSGTSNEFADNEAEIGTLSASI